MFTVCPKCALTLVVTAQDLRVAQGYVRCGRCSNVFNAIVGLTDDRGALAHPGSQGTATTSIIRKAPSLSDDPPPAQDSLGDTGESEAIYAEPDAEEVKFQEVFAEPTPPTRSPARTPPPTPAPSSETRTQAISFVAPPPGPPVKAAVPTSATQTQKALDAQKRYSDTEGIDTFSESELEFNPAVTDVTKVFVEAAPVAYRGDATGKFRKFVMGAEQPDPTDPVSSSNPTATSKAAQAPAASNGAQGGAQNGAPGSARSRGANTPPAGSAAAPGAKSSGAAGAPQNAQGTGAAQRTGSGANTAASNARSAGAQATVAGNTAAGNATAGNSAAPYAGAANANATNGATPGAKPGAARNGAPASSNASASRGASASSSASAASGTASTGTFASQAPSARTPPASSLPPIPPDRDDEDLEIDSDLRSLAARLDGTASRPAPKFPAAAANDEALEGAADEDEGDGGGSLGDIYAKAVPRPRPPPPAPTRSGTAARRAQRSPFADNGDEFGDDLTAAADADAEMQAVDSAIETFTPAAPPRSRFMWWVAGAAVLSLVLVGQAIHHNRHSLATNALLNRPLTKFYKAIGVTLVPSWDLRSYDVRQLGASTNDGGDGTLTVRASLKNNSSQPLPLPLLRITMQDRYGNRIATRDVPPSGYSSGAVPAEAHLGVGQRIDAEMTFKDPGQNAVGFEIDACLSTAAGRIACANDQAPALR